MKKLKLVAISIFILIPLLLLSACSTTNNNILIDNVNNTTSVSIEQKSFIDSFLLNFNNTSTTPISNYKNFTANDKSSPYYRTEFRLLAFENATSIHGNIGNSEIDMIDYSSQSGNTYHTKFRVYLKSNNIEEIKQTSLIIIKILDSTITNDEIEEAYTSLSNSFSLGEYIKGTLIKNEIMIDFSKID